KDKTARDRIICLGNVIVEPLLKKDVKVLRALRSAFLRCRIVWENGPFRQGTFDFLPLPRARRFSRGSLVIPTPCAPGVGPHVVIVGVGFHLCLLHALPDGAVGEIFLALSQNRLLM